MKGFFPNLIIIMLVYCSLISQAQTNNSTTIEKSEKVYIHLKNKILISGDLLEYKTYLANDEGRIEPKLSTIIYFEIKDVTGQSLISWKSTLTNHSVTGQYLLPNTLPSGLYYLTGYTNRMRIFSQEKLFKSYFLIEKLNQKCPPTLTIQKLNFKDSMEYSSNSDSIFESRNSYYLDLSLENNSFEAGKPIEVKLQLMGRDQEETAQLSISVTQKTPFDELLQQPSLEQEMTTLEARKDARNKTFSHNSDNENPAEKVFQRPYIKESGFSVIKGIITSDSTRLPFGKQVIYLSFADSLSHLSYATTNERGEFTFFIDSMLNNRSLILELYGSGEKTIHWFIDDKQFKQELSNDTVSIHLTNEQTEFIDMLRKRQLIDQIYFPVTKPELKQAVAFPVNFYYSPNYTVYPDNYELLSNFTEICENIIPNVRFKKDHKGYTISMYLSENQQLVDHDILVCLNGVPFSNLNFIAKLSSREIERIEVLNSTILFGELTFNGIISIFTRNRKISSEQFSSPVFTLSNRYYDLAHAENKQSENNLPNVNSTIYWNPQMTIQQGSSKSIILGKADIKADYMIQINGYTSKGNPVSITKQITVR